MKGTLRALALVIPALSMCALVAGAQGASPIQARLFEPVGKPGNVVRLDVTCACETTAASARAFDREVPLFRDGNTWRGLIGIDLAVKPGSYPIALSLESAGPRLSLTRNLVVVDKQFPVRRLTVAPTFVDPPANELERITAESAALQAIFANAARARQWQGPFQSPVTVPANSSFGARSVFNGQQRSPHSGADFSAKAGTPVSAPGAGLVVLAKSLYFTGNTVVLDHGLGLYSLLAHLTDFSVSEGDRIERGDLVGTVGATGRVTGPHLHWGVLLNGTRVDPLSLLAVTKETNP